jgi:hypothetical protein
MKKIILFLTVFLSTLALAGERVIINPEQDQDIKIKVNDGGTVKDAVTVTGSTGNVTIGNTAHTGTNELGGVHKVIGVITPGVVESGDASGGLSIWANAYGGASFPYRSQTAPGGAVLRIIPRTGDTNGAFVFQANKAGDSTTTSASTIGFANQNGSWELGPNSSGNTLTLYKTGDTPSLKFEGGATDYSMDILSGSLRFYNNGGTATGTVTQAGAWTIGPTDNTQTHNVRGGLRLESPGSSFTIVGTFTPDAGNNTLCYNTSSGLVSRNNGACGTSSRATKKNIVPLSNELDSGSIIDSLEPVVFTYKVDYKNHKRQIGFVAEDIEKVIPHLVDYDEKMKPEGVLYDKTVALLVAELQSLRKRVAELENAQ